MLRPVATMIFETSKINSLISLVGSRVQKSNLDEVRLETDSSPSSFNVCLNRNSLLLILLPLDRMATPNDLKHFIWVGRDCKCKL